MKRLILLLAALLLLWLALRRYTLVEVTESVPGPSPLSRVEQGTAL